MTTEPLRVLLVDDHEEFRTGLSALLAAVDGCEVVGSAADGHEAVALALDLQPDVVLMDLQMPKVNGMDATARIVQSSPHISVVVLTMMEDPDSVFAAVRAGARGYLLKGASREEILRAIGAVGDGQTIFGPAVAERVLASLADPERAAAAGRARGAASDGLIASLTGRELEVLDLVAAGLANRAIAQRLFLSPKTVRNHVSNVFTKIGVGDRSQAIVVARDAGLGRSG